MTKAENAPSQPLNGIYQVKANLNICKIGAVMLDYSTKFPNVYRNFSSALPQIFELLDNEECGTAIFLLFSVITRDRYPSCDDFENLKNIKAILLEKFQDRRPRKLIRYVIYYKTASKLTEYVFQQVFGTLRDISREEMDNFIKNKIPKRICGNCSVLLCGEIKGVKYSKSDKQVHDSFGLLKAIPNEVDIILNPIHDSMTRFEMKLKKSSYSKTTVGLFLHGTEISKTKTEKLKTEKGLHGVCFIIVLSWISKKFQTILT